MKNIQIHSDLDFVDAFPNEEACIKYLENKRWNGTPKCPSCNNTKNNYFLKTRNIHKCSSCKKQFSVKQGTIFQSSKLPLRTWFFVIYYFLQDKRGISSCQIAKRMNIQQKTAWLMLSKIRETMKDENMKSELSGIIEVDETWVGSNPSRDLRLQRRMDNHCKSSATGTKGYEHLKTVIGLIDRYNSKIVLRKIGWNRSCLNNEIANTILKKHVNTISTIISDGDKGYSKVNKHFHSHGVIVKDKSIEKRRKDGSMYTFKYNKYVNDKTHVNGIENVWKHLKNGFVTTYIHFSYKHTDRYLDEFSFRWNRKDFSVSRFLRRQLRTLLGKHSHIISWFHGNMNIRVCPGQLN